MRSVTVCHLPFLTLLWLLMTLLPAQAKQVHDWFTWCDEVLMCSMQAENSDLGIYALGFQRSPKAESEPEIYLSMQYSLSPEASIVLDIDDGVKGRFELLASNAVEDEGVWRFPGANTSHQILNAMMQGRKMQIILRTSSETEGQIEKTIPLSLKGVTGSALHIDDQQGRLGRRDAMQAIGEAEPQDAVTRASRLSSSADLPAPVLKEWQAHDGECSEDYDGGDLVSRFGGTRIDGEENNHLYVLPCGSPGAYNLPHTVIAYDSSEAIARRLYFPTLSPNGPTIMETAINLAYEPREDVLSAFYKGRGLGDCGIASTWKWDGYLYAQLTLLRETRKEDCDGKDTEWPQVWPIK